MTLLGINFAVTWILFSVPLQNCYRIEW